MRTELRGLLTLCVLLVLFTGVAAAQGTYGDGTIAFDLGALLADLLSAIADTLNAFADSLLA